MPDRAPTPGVLEISDDENGGTATQVILRREPPIRIMRDDRPMRPRGFAFVEVDNTITVPARPLPRPER